MANTLTKTDFKFEGQKSVYHGKVRDVYDINDDLMVMVATDRISAFDVILPKGIPARVRCSTKSLRSFSTLQPTLCQTGSWLLPTQWLPLV